jgi:hypothetical protein
MSLTLANEKQVWYHVRVGYICITEYTEIVPTVNKVNAEQYKMKFTR